MSNQFGNIEFRNYLTKFEVEGNLILCYDTVIVNVNRCVLLPFAMV